MKKIKAKLNALKNQLKIQKQDINLAIISVLAAVLVFAGIYANRAYGEPVSLSVTVNTTSTFTSSTNNFPALTPGTYVKATTTLSVATNTTGGWYIELNGDERATGNTTMDLSTDTSVGLTDDTEWIPGSATTSAGNATTITAGDDILAFRAMSASGSLPFRSTAWWGTSDAEFNAGQLWAGFSSTTATNERIGQVSSGDYQSTTQLISVQYYLDAPATQQTGSYTGGLTYTLVTP